MARIELALGQNFTIRARIMLPDKLELVSDAADGAILLVVKPLADAWAINDKILFAENRILTVTSPAVIGDETIAVATVNGILKKQAIGQKISQLAGATLAMEVSLRQTDTTPAITLAGTIEDDPDDSVAPKSKVAQIVGTPSDTLSESVGNYYFAVWRRDINNLRPLVDGDLVLAAKGFI